MKKTLIATVIAASMVSGCSMFGATEQTPATLNLKAQELSTQQYTNSSIQQVEQVRLIINSLFTESVPIYSDYAKHIETNQVGGQVSSALMMKESDEERDTFIADLKANKNDDYNAYIAFINDTYMDSIYKRSLKVGAEIAVQTLAFNKIDQSALLGELDFSQLGTEKDKLTLTTEQISVLNDTVYSLYQEYQYNKAAELIR
ncbi:hypothetical protein [Photobacterium chitinilyticum]|nr:hypothetical protein [Photobacterium chitinilyticum]